jgi:long-chain acyl-CoA synthetase
VTSRATQGQYASRPWLARYGEGKPGDIVPEHPSALAMFKDGVRRAGERDLLRYFDTPLTGEEVDAASDALAVALAEQGIARGDRVALFLQNVPQYELAMLATWKLGAIAVACSPMLKEKELRAQLQDSGAAALVTLESLQHDVARKVLADTDVRVVVTTSELDYLEQETPSVLAGAERRRPEDTLDLCELVEGHRGQRPPDVELGPDDVAFLSYTSGTTGPAKGAMNTHGNIVFNAQTYREWMDLTPDDVVLGIAPLFHITGLIGHLAVGMLVPMTTVIAYRFDPAETCRLIERHGTTFTVAAITAYIALLNHPAAREHDLSVLHKAYSGGAPISPSTTDAWEELTGRYIHNIYGLTETNSPSHAVPMGARAPIDPGSGALSVGVPVFNTVVRVIDDKGDDVPLGEIGELATSGPQVVPGYWNKPEETAGALPGGELRTGDVGRMDADGWFYVVDRRKDLIITSGYNVWPRDVEDVLYQHPAVLEAAVVGVSDAYRGEAVRAFVSLKPGQSASADELRAFAKERLAAYKAPREVEVLDELPKTPTGKILRRELRAGLGVT